MNWQNHWWCRQCGQKYKTFGPKVAGQGKGKGALRADSLPPRHQHSQWQSSQQDPSLGQLPTKEQQSSAQKEVQQQQPPQPDADAIRATIAALTACLKRIPKSAEADTLRDDLQKKIDEEKSKLRDLKPLKVRIAKTKEFLERRQQRLEQVRKDIAKLQSEEKVIVTTIASNQCILEEMEAIVLKEEQTIDDAELALFLETALKEGNPKLVSMAKNIQSKVKVEVVEIEDDASDDGLMDLRVDDEGPAVCTDAYYEYALAEASKLSQAPATPKATSSKSSAIRSSSCGSRSVKLTIQKGGVMKPFPKKVSTSLDVAEATQEELPTQHEDLFHDPGTEQADQ
jgi:hypothetical protein